MDYKSEYIDRAVKLTAQTAAIDDPMGREMLQALIDAYYRAADARPGSSLTYATGAMRREPAVAGEVAGSRRQFSQTAEWLRQQIVGSTDAEVVRQLVKLAEEYELLASVVETLEREQLECERLEREELALEALEREPMNPASKLH